MVAHGWHEAPSMGEHFGQKLTKDGVTSTFHQIDNTDFAHHAASTASAATRPTTATTIPAWTDIADQLS